jgi:DNA repair protein RAD50
MKVGQKSNPSSHTALILWKKLDTNILEAQAPIDALENEYKQSQSSLNLRISEAQRLSQELNMSVDKLAHTNKGVER